MCTTWSASDGARRAEDVAEHVTGVRTREQGHDSRLPRARPGSCRLRAGGACGCAHGGAGQSALGAETGLAALTGDGALAPLEALAEEAELAALAEEAALGADTALAGVTADADAEAAALAAPWPVQQQPWPPPWPSRLPPWPGGLGLRARLPSPWRPSPRRPWPSRPPWPLAPVRRRPSGRWRTPCPGRPTPVRSRRGWSRPCRATGWAVAEAATDPVTAIAPSAPVTTQTLRGRGFMRGSLCRAASTPPRSRPWCPLPDAARCGRGIGARLAATRNVSARQTAAPALSGAVRP